MTTMRSHLLGWSLVFIAAVGVGVASVAAAAEKSAYHSVYDVAYAPDGGLLAASDFTAGRLVLLSGDGKKVQRSVALNGTPAGLCWAGDKLYVAELGAGTVAEVDAKAGKVVRRIEAGPRVAGVAVAPKAKLLVATSSGTNEVLLIDLGSGKVKSRVPSHNEPRDLAVTPDESLAIVCNLLPYGDASKATMSAALTLIDLKAGKKAKDIKLPSGCAMVRGVAVSPDGKWAYVVHTLGRFTLPTTQLDRGWINTNAMSVIDLSKREHYATVLLDRLTEGAADPWDCAVSGDGKRLFVTLSGVHQLGIVELDNLHLLMEGKDLPKEEPAPGWPPRHLSPVWQEVKKDPANRAKLANDLAALYAAGLLDRVRLNCNGPRGVSLAPDGKTVAVGAYFSGDVLTLNPADGKALAATAVGKQPAADSVRTGEQIFHDATYCFQHWLSCATCHPEGRADGLNWDLLNDGIGNPKNSKSLLLAHKTPPAMSLGVRASYAVASEAGFRFILFREPAGETTQAVKDYLSAMAPAQSPYLVDGKLSEAARKGKEIFESKETRCASCHPSGLFTDLKMYDVGTRGELDRKDAFDTPTLIELWRTAPYLHDGSAKDLNEVLTTRNKGDRHGKTSHLNEEQIDQLTQYLLSL